MSTETGKLVLNIKVFSTYECNQIENNKENLDKSFFQDRLNAELEKVNEELSLIFNLRFREEMSIKEISRIMDCPEGTIKSRLFHLTKSLSAKLSIYKQY